MKNDEFQFSDNFSEPAIAVWKVDLLFYYLKYSARPNITIGFVLKTV